jgi:hypothetical protein
VGAGPADRGRYWKVFAAQKLDDASCSIAHAFILDDTTSVTQQVDAINLGWRNEQHPALAPDLPESPQRKNEPTVVYWCPIGNIKSVVGFDASPFEKFAAPDQMGTAEVQAADFDAMSPHALSLPA